MKSMMLNKNKCFFMLSNQYKNKNDDNISDKLLSKLNGL